MLPRQMEIDRAREVIPDLLRRLRSWGRRGEIKANWIEDVYSEVLKGISSGDLADDAWIDDLLDVCNKQLKALREVLMEEVEVVAFKRCDGCKGSGYQEDKTACPTCKGSGRRFGTLSLKDLIGLLAEERRADSPPPSSVPPATPYG